MIPKRKKLKDEINFAKEDFQIGSVYNVRLKNNLKSKFKKTIKTQKDIKNIKNRLFVILMDDQF
ncbi:MAG: hypothetical protein ACJA2M_001573 [Polaribacter sp.]|jgi:hypothetical protein